MKLRYTPACSAVRVTDAYAANAFRRETDYLLSLETGRLLAGFCENAGIRTPYVRYGGWENSLIGGHTLGHYLSALSRGYAVSEGAVKQGLLRKLEEIVSTLAECQRAGKSGLVWGALPVEGGPEAQFDNVERGKTDIKREAWVPWYTLHKILSGLIDVCMIEGGPKSLLETARKVACGLGDWVCRRALSWDEAVRKKVLSVEYGGMNDSLYSLYALTGEPAYARAAHVFDEEELFDGVLSGQKDFLDGKHANTTIPKFLGALNRYFTLHGTMFEGETIDASRYFKAAEAFFKTVAQKHTYVTGGNSEWEHFGKDGVLDAERTECNCETCNAYNMLKLARGLFSATGEKAYLDFYDNAFLNDILASQNPETGMTTYFQPMAGGYFKVFSRPYDKFWCCTGSGMESFTRLGDGIFYEGEGEIVLARYLSSSYEGAAALTVRAEGFGERVTVEVRRAKRPINLKLRVPDWCEARPAFEQNGRPAGEPEGGFLTFSVCEGDVVCGRFPAAFALCGLPDGEDVFALKYGGVVYAADLGAEDLKEGETGVEVNIPARRILPTEALYFKDVRDVLTRPEAYFRREGERVTLEGADIPLVFYPYYRLYGTRYALYFRYREGVRAREGASRQLLDSLRPGYGQYEADDLHEMREEGSVGTTSNGNSRYAQAGGYFEYDLAVDPEAPAVLEICLRREDDGKPLKISAEGVVLFEGPVRGETEEAVYTMSFPIPEEIRKRAREKTVHGKLYRVVAVRFEGDGESESACICDTVRVYRD